ncbi:MAG: hypothetical protein ACI3XI_09160 [Eubacteriales bacterium]
MKFVAFTKLGIIRILASSLMLSVYVSVILINFASDELTTGAFFATLVFIVALTAFLLFARIKNHPPLHLAVRGWLAASAVMCVITFFVAISGAEISGVIGGFLGFVTMLFVSPFFGFGYLLGNAAAVSVAGLLSCISIYLLPFAIERIIERQKLMKKYR